MVFSGLTFLLIFLPLLLLLYFVRGSIRWRNGVLVVFSLIFYAWGEPIMVLLLVGTTLLHYFCARKIASAKRTGERKLWLALAVFGSLSALFWFKYAGFVLGTVLGIPFDAPRLPIGISFYTFQILTYTIDVYRRQVRPTKDPIAFFAFISFFPQLVAGPIERASNLLPQFLRRREFSYERAVDGCRQMLWGFFKKCVVADNCAVVADLLLNDASQPNGLGVWLGVFLFTVQIYGDFSGYSDIAIGVSRLFGVDLKRNFAYPYFARDIAEFWRRWHMSLTTWFRDYLYIPLGGSRCGRWRQVRNTFAIFLTSGLWHGANWTFVLWGAFHALLFLPLLLAGRNRRRLGMTAEGRALPSAGEAAGMAGTFLLVLLGWVLFRARSAGEALRWYGEMFNPCTFGALHGLPREVVTALLGAAGMFAAEWAARRGQHALSRLPRMRLARWAAYYVLLWLVVFYAPGSQTFIYFQF